MKKEKIIQIIVMGDDKLVFLTDKGRVIKQWSVYRNTENHLVDITPNLEEVDSEVY